MIGQKFNKLTVIERAGSDKHQKALWLCRCECGNETTAVTQQLRAGKKKSCGCIKAESIKHRWEEYRKDNKPFWSKVNKTDGCWLWIGSKDSGGYGLLGTANENSKKAHRVSWKIHNGPIPTGMCVLHKCDIRNCVNPEHLFLGTQADNMRDMAQKERRSGISIHGRKILSDDEVYLIKSAYKEGILNQSDIAREFGVTPGCINHIVHGRRT
jgi:hypothetical protein